ncbi:MAG: glycosyltransferase involved in cell wall biosynthesis, partial [Gammaproteobacteria bacterium]
PGDPNTRTGGYIYDARITAGLRDLGWAVDVRRLHDGFPTPNSAAVAHAAQQLEAIEDHALVLIDGLAFGAMPSLAHQHRERLTLFALVHHPLAAETGLSRQQTEMLARSERNALAAAHHVIVTGARTATTLATHYAVPESKLSVVVPGTDSLARRPKQSRTMIVDADVRLLCVATVTPRKGHDVLIDALAPLAGQGWQLRCAGSLERSTSCVRHVQRAIEAAGLREQVQLLGEVDSAALQACYDWADVFVLPTHLEGYGMALAEALANGLAIITTKGGAAADTVGAQAALLVPPADAGALSAALQRVLHEPSLRRDLAAGARQRAQQLPSWTDAALAMQHVLQRHAA